MTALPLCISIWFTLSIMSFTTINGNQDEIQCLDTKSNIHETSHSRNIRNIILDIDPGIDDAFAMLWLLSQSIKGVLDIHAITTTHGNTSPFDSFRNVIHLINITNIESNEASDIIIGKMDINSKEAEEFEPADDFFTGDGIGNLSKSLFYRFPDMFSTLKDVQILFNRALSSTNIIVESLLNHPYEMTIITGGPLTNLMLAEKEHPGILSFAREILIMGGSVLEKIGNSEGMGEFNFLSDSQSMIAFFETINGYKRAPNVFLFPLDITNTLQWTTEDVEILFSMLDENEQSDIDLCRMKLQHEYEENFYAHVKCSQNGILYVMMEKWTNEVNKVQFQQNGDLYLLMHDSASVGYLLYPNLYDFKHVFLRIETENAMTWFDQRNRPLEVDSVKVPNVFVALDVDSSTVVKLFTRDLWQLMNKLSRF